MMFVYGVVVLLLLTTLTDHAYSMENGDDLLDTITKLTNNLSQLSAQMAQQSKQLNEVSNKQKEQSEQLTGQSHQLTEQSNTLGRMSDQQAELNDRINILEEESSAGPTFVRWGKSACNGTNANMVYSGVASGTSAVQSGGGANLLCLPKNPSFANYDGTNGDGLNVVVAEYKLNPSNNFPFESNDPLLLDNDVPCAVCEVTNGSSVMMIPAKVDCYSGWKLEYRGYLMTEIKTTYRSEFICVDKNPEVLFGGAGPADHSIGLYPTESWCGPPSLPCPPYEPFWELACVVCSK